MPSKPPPLCVVSSHTQTRRDLAELLAAQGHKVVQAGGLSSLVRYAKEGIAAAIVDPRTRGLGPTPLARMRAEPALHRCPILVLRDDEVAGLSGGHRPSPALIALMLRIHAQVAGGAQVGLLQDISELLTAAPDTVSTMRNILEAVTGLVSTDTATLFLVNEDAIEACAAWGYDLAAAELRRVDRGEGVVGWVIEQCAPTIVGDSDLDTRFHGVGGRSKRSMLAVPLLVGHRVLGAITLTRRAPAEQFSDADLVLVGTISNSAGIALEASRIYEQERAVRRRLAQVEEMRRQEREFLDKLEEYDRLYTQVVATVSHELKTPLMGIRGFAQMIRDGRLEPEELVDFAGEIHDNAVRLSLYVEGILDEDAVHSGRLRLEPAPVRLQPLVAQVLHAIAPLTSQRHRIVDAVPATLPPVWGDGDMLLQVLTNLVTNAVKYSPAGGRITVAATPTQGGIALVVEDQGMGIPEEARGRVFDRFYRVPGEQTRHIPGTGLGLSIVRGLVELHGGTIRVESGRNSRGTRFTVTLPGAVARTGGNQVNRSKDGLVALSRIDNAALARQRLSTGPRSRSAIARLADSAGGTMRDTAGPIAEVS